MKSDHEELNRGRDSASEPSQASNEAFMVVPWDEHNPLNLPKRFCSEEFSLLPIKDQGEAYLQELWKFIEVNRDLNLIARMIDRHKIG